jgi:hypothetical protein
VLSSAASAADFTERIDGWAYSHDWKNGLKLMEHSWVGNKFVDAIVRDLVSRPRRLVWAGDYADPEPGVLVNGDLATLYHYVYETVHLAPYQIKPADHDRVYPARYLVNHDLKVFVDMKNLPEDREGWQIHPLPLLTAEGNGRGGGDFGGHGGRHSKDAVGSWARHEISVLPASSWKRFESLKRMGYAEVVPEFME